MSVTQFILSSEDEIIEYLEDLRDRSDDKDQFIHNVHKLRSRTPPLLLVDKELESKFREILNMMK